MLVSRRARRGLRWRAPKNIAAMPPNALRSHSAPKSPDRARLLEMAQAFNELAPRPRQPTTQTGNNQPTVDPLEQVRCRRLCCSLGPSDEAKDSRSIHAQG